MLLNACVGNRVADLTPLTAEERDQFLSRAQDERRFWLTRYESEQGPSFAGAHRLHTEKQVRVPFQTRRDHPAPMMNVRLRGAAEHRALIDTSARYNWIEFGLAHENGLIPIGPPPIRLQALHVNDPVPGYVSVASRMVIDTLHINTALFSVKAAHGPMTLLTRDQQPLRAPIVLGSDFVRAFHFIQFDFPNRMITLSTTTPYEPDRDRLLAVVPLQEINGTIAVEGFMDGTRTPFLLDTLGSYGVASDRPVQSTVERLMVGDLVLLDVAHTPIASLALGRPTLPRIGLDVLERLILTFDGGNGRVYFERP